MGVPTYGAIILDETLDNVSMLQPERTQITLFQQSGNSLHESVLCPFFRATCAGITGARILGQIGMGFS